MATVRYQPTSDVATRKASIFTPFVSKAYGGYTESQWKFFEEHIGKIHGKVVLDPMAGQAHAVSQLSWRGYSVFVGDLNPAPLMLATLRSPRLLAQAESIRSTAIKRISPLRKYGVSRRVDYVDDWISPLMREQLEQYRKLFDLDFVGNPTDKSRAFWDVPDFIQFAAALPILAAREITCFRGSDNVTWLKKGGLQRNIPLVDALLRAIDKWYELATSARLLAPGNLHVSWMDTESGNFGAAPKADIIVTSPPYGNRLDYTRMWAPELQVFSALFGTSPDSIKAKQIGSTVVRGRSAPAITFSKLPTQIRRVLEEIRTDTLNVSSESYYYPFFLNYATSMAQAFSNLPAKLKVKGRMVVFVRDTVRKDVLFPTADLIRRVLSGFQIECTGFKKIAIKRHVGMRRRSSSAGMYGTAQTEWWLCFERRT